MKRLLSLILLLPLNTFSATLYVGDNLRVGIRPAPEANTASLLVVNTGTELELIEKKGKYIKVRSPNGVEGWVKGAYLSSNKPSSILLKQATSKIKQLEKKINALSKNNTNTRSTHEANAQTHIITRLQSEKTQLEQQITSLRTQSGNAELITQENNSLSLRFNFLNNELIMITLGSLIFLLSLGFLFGVSWHKHQVTKRLGGLSL